MSSRQRRVHAIELTLTPREVVLVWLRNALQAETLEEAARRTPPPRKVVANAVRDAVRNSMKGQEESVVERAALQACQEADSLYCLAVHANVTVAENKIQRERERESTSFCWAI